MFRTLSRQLQTFSADIHDLWENSRNPPFRRELILPNHLSKLPLHPRDTPIASGTISEIDSPELWSYENYTNAGPSLVETIEGTEGETRSGYATSSTPMPQTHSFSSTIPNAGSHRSDDEAQEAVMNLLESLSQRGTGEYVCPYGVECPKGGSSPNGRLVVFTRNSAFRSVDTKISMR